MPSERLRLSEHFVDRCPQRQKILVEFRAATTGALGLGPESGLDAYTKLLYPGESLSRTRLFARYRDGSALWALRVLEKLGIRHPGFQGSRSSPEFHPRRVLAEVASDFGAWTDVESLPEGAWVPWPAPGHLVVFGGDPTHVSVIVDEDNDGRLVSIDAGQAGEGSEDDDRRPDGSIQIVRRCLVRKTPGILQAFHPITFRPGRQVVGVADVLTMVRVFRAV